MKKINIIITLCFILLFCTVSRVGAFSSSNVDGELTNDLVYQENLPYLMNVQFESYDNYGLVNLNINSCTMNYDLYSRLVGLETMPNVTNSSGILETSDTYEIIESAPGTYYSRAKYNEYRDTFETTTYIPIRFTSDTLVKVDFYFNNVFTNFSLDWCPNFIIASDDNWTTSVHYIQDYVLVTDKHASVNGTTKANKVITTSQNDFQTSYRPFGTYDIEDSEFKTLKVSYRFKVSKNNFGGLVIRISPTNMTKYPHYLSDFTVVEESNVDFNGWILSIFSAFNSFFAIKFGNVTLGSILLIPLILSVVFVVIRLWRGGAE